MIRRSILDKHIIYICPLSTPNICHFNQSKGLPGRYNTQLLSTLSKASW
jgi:hypothetical protein